jgi:lysyl-tRNA synthetase class 1
MLMLKRFVGSRTISILDIPTYMNEFDELEDTYFGNKQIADKKDMTKLSGLYKYCWWLKPPVEPSLHVPYNLLSYLAKVAVKGKESQYMITKLREYSYLKEKDTINLDLQRRIEYALNWNQDFAEIKETATELTDNERAALKELIQVLQTQTDADQIQTAVFNIARSNNVKPGQFFKTMYMILLGTPAGPRLGPYVIAMGRQNVVKALERTLER